MTGPDPLETCYRIDAADRIVWVDDAWRAFARANGAPELPERALGTLLWDHVEGAGVEAALQALLDHARDSQRLVRVPFRCDAPTLRRFMTLTVAPHGHRGLELRSTVERVEPRSATPIPLAGGPSSGDLLEVCAWCRRFRVDCVWRDPEEGVTRLGVFLDERLPRVTHGICADCYARQAALLP